MHGAQTIFLWVFCFVLPWSSRADISLKFKTSKVHALYNFVETIADFPHRNSAIREIFQNSKYNDKIAQKWIKEFLKLEGGLRQQILVSHEGISLRQVGQLILVRSVFVESIDQLSEMILGLLSFQDHVRLMRVLSFFLPIYENLIWHSSVDNLVQQAESMKSSMKQSQLEHLFDQAKLFYGSLWPEEMSFTVSLWPIPLVNGESNAESLGAVQSMGLLRGPNREIDHLSVLFHELSHTLYFTQSSLKREKISRCFEDDPSAFASIAHSF